MLLVQLIRELYHAFYYVSDTGAGFREKLGYFNSCNLIKQSHIHQSPPRSQASSHTGYYSWYSMVLYYVGSLKLRTK